MKTTSRREISFVRYIIAGKKAILDKNCLYKIDLRGKKISLLKTRVFELISDGVLSFKNGEIRANSLTKNWLKRQKAIAGEEFVGQHRDIKIDREGVKTNMNESVLSRLSVAQKGKEAYLLPYQVEAGRRFASLYYRARLNQRVSMSYGAFSGGKSKKNAVKGGDISDMAIDAKREIEKILTKLPKDCAFIIVDICGMEKGLQLVEVERGLPRRSAKLVLRIALEQLAMIFGLSNMRAKKE